MPHIVTIAPGYNGVTLPDGNQYDAGAQVVLTSDEYFSIKTSLLGTVVLDGGATSEAVGAAFSKVTTASTNAALVKSSGGVLYEITVSNVTATATYVKVYDKASTPTVGTDVPLLTVPAPANATQVLSFGPQGKRFVNGISLAATAAIAATDVAVAVAGAQISLTYL